MKIYGVEFKITEECVDKQRIEVVPGEGAIIPLVLNNIEGLYDYLIRNRCIRKNKIDMIYIFSATASGEVLCVKYSDEVVSVIQDVGEVSFFRNILHNNI